MQQCIQYPDQSHLFEYEVKVMFNIIFTFSNLVFIINKNMPQIHCYVILYNANTHTMYIMMDKTTYDNTKHLEATVINVNGN